MSDFLADINAQIYLALALALIGVLYWPYRDILARHVPLSFRAGLFVAALLFRLVNIGGESLWYDEAFTAHMVTLPLDRLIAATAGDVHPPLFYLVVKMVTQAIGHSEAALRLTSAVFGAGAVVLVYDIALYYVPKNPARLAAWLACFLPGLLRYGQEARMYTMLAFWLLLALNALISYRPWLLCAALGLALYTHAYAWLYVVALSGVWLFDLYKRRWALFPILGAIVLYLPWLPMLAKQISHVSGGYWIPSLSLGTVIEPLITLTFAFRSPIPIFLGLSAVAIALTMAGLVVFWRENGAGAARLIGFLFLPPILAILASFVIRPVYLGRAFIPSIYLLPIAWSYWLYRLSPITVPVAIALTAGVLFFYFPAHGERADVRGFVARLPLEAHDTVYHTEIASYLLLGYYMPAEVNNYIFPYASDLSQSLDPSAKAAMNFQQGRYANLRQTDNALWLITVDTPWTSPQQTNENNFILARYHPELVASWDMHSLVRVRAYREILSHD